MNLLTARLPGEWWCLNKFNECGPRDKPEGLVQKTTRARDVKNFCTCHKSGPRDKPEGLRQKTTRARDVKNFCTGHKSGPRDKPEGLRQKTTRARDVKNYNNTVLAKYKVPKLVRDKMSMSLSKRRKGYGFSGLKKMKPIFIFVQIRRICSRRFRKSAVSVFQSANKHSLEMADSRRRRGLSSLR